MPHPATSEGYGLVASLHVPLARALLPPLRGHRRPVPGTSAVLVPRQPVHVAVSSRVVDRDRGGGRAPGRMLPGSRHLHGPGPGRGHPGGDAATAEGQPVAGSVVRSRGRPAAGPLAASLDSSPRGPGALSGAVRARRSTHSLRSAVRRHVGGDRLHEGDGAGRLGGNRPGVPKAMALRGLVEHRRLRRGLPLGGRQIPAIEGGGPVDRGAGRGLGRRGTAVQMAFAPGVRLPGPPRRGRLPLADVPGQRSGVRNRAGARPGGGVREERP